MSKTISRFALAASVALALAFTFSCSSDDKDDGSGGGGGGSVNNVTVDTIYTEITCNDGGCTGEKWNGNGTVKMEVRCGNEGNKYIDVGEIVNGMLSLNLPLASEIPESCFHNATELSGDKSVSPSDVKVVWGDYDFNVVNGVGDDGKLYNILKWEVGAGWKNVTERVRGRYLYFSKAVKITGGGYNINASEGWNEVYSNDKNENFYMTTDLNAIGGTKPIWYIDYYPPHED